MPLSRQQIIERIQKAKGLPAYPQVLARLEQEFAKPQPSAAGISRIVEQDPALVARLLRVANSALHTGKSDIAHVQNAVLRLGLVETRRLVLACALVEKCGSLLKLDDAGFWPHSLAVALAARAIVQASSATIPESTQQVAYLGGLLHDVGVLLLFHLFPQECTALREKCETDGRTVDAIERDEWGLDHGEAGALLARQWRLPLALIQAIQFHHEPWRADGTHRLLVAIVHISNFVCNNQGFGRAGAGFPEAFDSGCWDALGLTLEQVPQIIASVRQQGAQSVVLAQAMTGG